jgi:phosphate transport system permease protein
VSVLTTVGIVVVLAYETLGFFREVSFTQFFADTEWTPRFASRRFGVAPLLCGTLLTASIGLGLAVPTGLLGAIYLTEFASPLARRTLTTILTLLAGMPTVVYGYIALVSITPILQRFIPGIAGFNAVSAGMAMGMMTLPLITTLSVAALRRVPEELREASLALGGDRVATLGHVILPVAAPGLGAAVLLATSRAVGETMIVAIAAGQQPRLTVDPRVPVETLSAYIIQISLGDVPAGSLEHSTLYAVGATLFALTLALNLGSLHLRRRFLRSTP